MKKSVYLSAALAGLLASSATARTWTSADGSKTFEGDFKELSAEQDKVTVTVKGKQKTFALTMLSEDDQKWVKQQLKEQAVADQQEALNAQKIGKLFSETKLSKLEGDAFETASFDAVPEYYLLYFTASW